MHLCEMMLKDISDSRRNNANIASVRKGNDIRFEARICVAACLHGLIVTKSRSSCARTMSSIARAAPFRR